MHVSKNFTLLLSSRVLLTGQLLEFGWIALSSRCDFQRWSNNTVRRQFFYRWYICNTPCKRPIVYRRSDLYCMFHLIPDPGRNMVVWIIQGFLFSPFLLSRHEDLCCIMSAIPTFWVSLFILLSVSYLFGTISSSDYISLAERVPRKDPSLDDISKPENWTCSISFQWQYKIQLKRFYLKLNI